MRWRDSTPRSPARPDAVGPRCCRRCCRRRSRPGFPTGIPAATNAGVARTPSADEPDQVGRGSRQRLAVSRPRWRLPTSMDEAGDAGAERDLRPVHGRAVTRARHMCRRRGQHRLVGQLDQARHLRGPAAERLGATSAADAGRSHARSRPRAVPRRRWRLLPARRRLGIVTRVERTAWPVDAGRRRLDGGGCRWRDEELSPYGSGGRPATVEYGRTSTVPGRRVDSRAGTRGRLRTSMPWECGTLTGRCGRRRPVPVGPPRRRRVRGHRMPHGR